VYPQAARPPGLLPARRPAEQAGVAIRNVLLRPTRALYEDFNAAFAKQWKHQENRTSPQAIPRSGPWRTDTGDHDGLERNVLRSHRLGCVRAEHRGHRPPLRILSAAVCPHAPLTRPPSLFLSGNGIQRRSRTGTICSAGGRVITPPPRPPGVRVGLPCGWVYALKHNNNDQAWPKTSCPRLHKTCPVLDSGAEVSTTTFVGAPGRRPPRWETKRILPPRLGPDKFEVVNPSLRSSPEPSVSGSIGVDKRGRAPR